MTRPESEKPTEAQAPNLWEGAYKIPWEEPGFSRRMLREHLSQEHDLASRRTGWIDKQVAWIHDHVLGSRPSRVLDLGCGPGLYCHALATLGHRCTGIDFGPASIDYAREHAPANAACDFVLADLCDVVIGGTYNLAMLLYGELNVFPPADAQAILMKAWAAFAAGGQLIVEPHAPGVIEATGRAAPSEVECPTGVFSDRPYVCRTESRWYEDERVTVQHFTVTDDESGDVQAYRSTSQDWPDESLVRLLRDAGFADAHRRDDWPCNTDVLTMWLTRKG